MKVLLSFTDTVEVTHNDTGFLTAEVNLVSSLILCVCACLRRYCIQHWNAHGSWPPPWDERQDSCRPSVRREQN